MHMWLSFSLSLLDSVTFMLLRLKGAFVFFIAWIS